MVQDDDDDDDNDNVDGLIIPDMVINVCSLIKWLL
jgi:hypothetical protein